MRTGPPSPSAGKGPRLREDDVTAADRPQQEGGRSGDSFRSHAGSLIAGCVAIFLAMATPSLVGNITGSIAVKLTISGTELNWAASSSGLGAALAAYLTGSLADRVGRRRMLVASAGVNAVGLVVAAFSGSLSTLIVGQVLAGVGAGGLGAISLTMVAAASRTAHRRPRYLAAFAASLSTGVIASAGFSALFATESSYRGAFLALAVTAALGMAVIALCGAESRAERPRPIDVKGQAFLMVTLTALLWAVIQGSGTRWGENPVIVAFLVAAAALTCFVLMERRPGSMLDLSVFRIPAFSLATVLVLGVWFVFIGSAYLWAIRLTVAQGHTPQFAAAGLILEGVLACATGFACRRMLSRFAGVRVLVVAGLVFLAVANTWLALAPIENRSFSAMLGYVLFLATGQAMTTAGVTAAAVNSVPAALESTAAATQEIMRVFGGPLGLAVLGGLLFSRAQSALDSRLPALRLPPGVGSTVSGINEDGGAVAIVGSGFADRIPSVGRAATAGLGEGLSAAAYVATGLSVLMAVGAAVFLRNWTARPGATPQGAKSAVPE
ncbi:MFS transporter [Streptomyces sp. NPDC049954]|uniref:MFS transporter n=1 Tax=Streptomyces sp. NPDC049954 TaxID=3155779 RepID=UPI003422259C